MTLPCCADWRAGTLRGPEISELDRTERRRQTTAELSESLRQYQYAKYGYRTPTPRLYGSRCAFTTH